MLNYANKEFARLIYFMPSRFIIFMELFAMTIASAIIARLLQLSLQPQPITNNIRFFDNYY